MDPMDETTKAPASQRIEEIRWRMRDNPDSEGGTVRDVEWVARQCKIAELATDLLAAYDHLQQRLVQVREMADAARPVLSAPSCACSGEGEFCGHPSRDLGWSLDPTALRAVLDGVLPLLTRGVL